MKTITGVVKISRQAPENDGIKMAVEVLKKGGIVVFPTDTVYGIAASAFNLGAQKRIYALKGRSYHKPLILMSENTESLKNIVEVPGHAGKMINKFWPGPLTLILPTTQLGKMICGGRSDLGVRVPDCRIALKLIRSCGFPLATTSANPSSKPSAKSAGECEAYFKGKVELILDGGICPKGMESTVVNACSVHYTVVREGCLKKKEILRYI